MFVKICGITDSAALSAALRAGADGVGFVFAHSPRQIAPAAAAVLCKALPRSIVRIAVMHHPDRETVDQVLTRFSPDWMQSDAEDFADIELPGSCSPLPVHRNGRLPAGDMPMRVLFEGAKGGSGETADWDEARVLSGKMELILAGGLTPDNVADAIRHVRPWGVDVSSGVERSRGQKDPAKIAAFVARVRAVETH